MPLTGASVVSLCVVHLVRCCNGVEPLRRFLAAYRRFPGGIDHGLLLLCKGFSEKRLPAEHHDALSGHRFQTLFVDDQGFDIGPYFAAAERTDYQFYCFLNSFSEPLDPNWLRKLSAGLGEPGMGAVAATGSAESRATFMQAQPRPRARSPWRQPYVDLRWRFALRHARRDFPDFPNYHLRSNALLVAREQMLALRRPIRGKLDAERFESGRDGLSARLRAQGLGVAVVGRDGVYRSPEHWAHSRTFRSGAQENLLVADNRTREYAQAETTYKRQLATWAWGTGALLP